MISYEDLYEYWLCPSNGIPVSKLECLVTPVDLNRDYLKVKCNDLDIDYVSHVAVFKNNAEEAKKHGYNSFPDMLKNEKSAILVKQPPTLANKNGNNGWLDVYYFSIDPIEVKGNTNCFVVILNRM